MGGFGSGRPRGAGRGTVEAHCALDADRLHRAGCLRAGWAGGWKWGDGEQGASVNLRAEPDHLHLTYRVRIGGGEWEDVAEAVPLVRVPCRFGGTRPYFLCPGAVDGIACGRRVSKLYAAGRHFRCRHCHRLGHASQGEDRWARRLRRANKVRERVILERLGGAPGLAALCPPKPKGMWLRTYARLLDQLLAAELLADQAHARRLRRLLARVNGSEWRDDDPEDERDGADPPAETAAPRPSASTRSA